MKVLMVASEATPFAKTGGLADVVGSLPPALRKLGEEVAVLMPKYRGADPEKPMRLWHSRPLWVGPHVFRCGIDGTTVNGIPYFLLDCPPLYDRAGIYGDMYGTFGDNHLRYALLDVAALQVAREIFRPDVFHMHDWQAGLLAAYLRVNLAKDPYFAPTRTVFTIHNVAYQGNFGGYLLGDLGVDPSAYHPEGLEYWGQVCFMKAGIVWSDAVNTVSPTYAREIQTPEYGYSMDGVLRSRSYKLSGILNGVDYQVWNPETDPHIAANYSASDLMGKLVCKRALLSEMDLADEPERPLIGVISRFADQKGFDLVEAITGWLLDQDLALVALGSGDARTEAMFRGLAAARPDRFALRTGYSEALAHRIEAAADMFLMPSRYEPCGLNQIFSLRYGTVPVVRATGGLADTVDEETGFLFRDYSPSALQAALTNALAAYRIRDAWVARMRRCMSRDFSWDRSANAYYRLYRSIVRP
jgi:starch synthase